MLKESLGSRIFDIFNVVFMSMCIIIMLFPLYNVFIISIISQGEFFSRPLTLWPQRPNLYSYQFIFSSSTIPKALGITIFITVVGTIISMVFTTMLAYGLSKKFLPGRNFFMTLILFTMFFGGGLIPFYMLVRDLGLINKVMVNILPTAVSAFNMIIMRTFFSQLPESLEESAYIDGANYFTILLRIVVPLSVPVLATMILFHGVGYWNTWWFSQLFVQDRSLHPLQLVLRRMVVEQEQMLDMGTQPGGPSKESLYAESIKMATVVVAVIPIICVYPFLQKYFMKGIMLGALKG